MINIIRTGPGVNVTRQGGGIQIIRDARGPQGSQDVTVAIFAGGPPENDEILCRIILPDAMGIDEELCDASAGNAPVIEQVFRCLIDDVQVATVTFPAGVADAVVAFDTLSWPAGVFVFKAPALCDNAIADISSTFTGAR